MGRSEKLKEMKRLTVIQYLILSPVALVIIYGFIRFPDAPIRPCHTIELQYCGKRKALHSESDYLEYRIVKKVLFTTFVIFAAPAAALGLMRWQLRGEIEEDAQQDKSQTPV
jgi:hypothetical protein